MDKIYNKKLQQFRLNPRLILLQYVEPPWYYPFNC